MPRIIGQNRVSRVTIASRNINQRPPTANPILPPPPVPQTRFSLQQETTDYESALIAAGHPLSSINAQHDSLNTMIYRLKQANLWTQMIAGYLMNGWTSSAGIMKNLRRDLPAYDGSAVGGPTLNNRGYNGPWSGSVYLDFPVPLSAFSGSVRPLTIFAGYLSRTQGQAEGPLVTTGLICSRDNTVDTAGEIVWIAAPPHFDIGGNGSLCTYYSDGAFLGGIGKNAQSGTTSGSVSGYPAWTQVGSMYTYNTGMRTTARNTNCFVVGMLLCFNQSISQSDYMVASRAVSEFLYDRGIFP